MIWNLLADGAENCDLDYFVDCYDFNSVAWRESKKRVISMVWGNALRIALRGAFGTSDISCMYCRRFARFERKANKWLESAEFGFKVWKPGFRRSLITEEFRLRM